VTLGTQAVFMNQNKGTHLICEAKCIKDGRQTCFYEVNVVDDLGTEITRVTVEGYKLVRK
jgi:acyl-CoA thioesterase